jgi:uncharacterized peroxidase-related enzyme
MPRLEPLPIDNDPELKDIAEASKARLGFVANSMRTLSRRPEIARAFMKLATAISGPTATLDPKIRNMVSQVVSRTAGCGYCMAHTAKSGLGVGIPAEKEDALWEYETSPLFSEAERVALRVAQGAAQVPNAVSDADFAELKKYFDDGQIVEIVATIALFGFLNRWNDTMATELESSPIEAGKRFLAARGWTLGKHAGKAVAAE